MNQYPNLPSTVISTLANLLINSKALICPTCNLLSSSDTWAEHILSCFDPLNPTVIQTEINTLQIDNKNEYIFKGFYNAACTKCCPSCMLDYDGSNEHIYNCSRKLLSKNPNNIPPTQPSIQRIIRRIPSRTEITLVCRRLMIISKETPNEYASTMAKFYMMSYAPKCIKMAYVTEFGINPPHYVPLQDSNGKCSVKYTNIHNEYFIDYNAPIGSGAVAQVFRCLPRNGRHQLVVKRINLRGIDEKYHTTEITILAKLKHENIIEIKEPFVNIEFDNVNKKKKSPILYIVMERADMNVTQFITQYWKMGLETSIVITYILFKFFCGLSHMHCNGIVHRDLKPDNILLKQGPQGTQVKIADCGVSADTRKPNVYTMASNQGTRGYQDPNIDGKTKGGFPQDLHSAGVTMIVMGFPNKFVDPNWNIDYIKNNLSKWGEEPAAQFINVKMVQCMLNNDMRERPTAGQVMNELRSILSKDKTFKGSKTQKSLCIQSIMYQVVMEELVSNETKLKRTLMRQIDTCAQLNDHHAMNQAITRYSNLFPTKSGRTNKLKKLKQKLFGNIKKFFKNN